MSKLRIAAGLLVIFAAFAFGCAESGSDGGGSSDATPPSTQAGE